MINNCISNCHNPDELQPYQTSRSKKISIVYRHGLIKNNISEAMRNTFVLKNMQLKKQSDSQMATDRSGKKSTNSNKILKTEDISLGISRNPSKEIIFNETTR